jgi:hypothetical protein
MEIKEMYFKVLRENNGQLNEIDLGKMIGLNEEETREVIAQLLSEHRIKYAENRSCNYRLNKARKRKNNYWQQRISAIAVMVQT